MSAMPATVEILVCALLLIGGVFSLVGAYGLAKLSDFFKRLHGPTKATTLGVGSILIASMLMLTSGRSGVSLRELLITLFLFLTAPVSAYLLAKAAMALRPGSRPAPPRDGE
jgi:multicomponent K+:H+ antiporter subunit G